MSKLIELVPITPNMHLTLSEALHELDLLIAMVEKVESKLRRNRRDNPSEIAMALGANLKRRVALHMAKVALVSVDLTSLKSEKKV